MIIDGQAGWTPGDVVTLPDGRKAIVLRVNYPKAGKCVVEILG